MYARVIGYNHGSSERQTCKTIGLARSTHHYRLVPKDDDSLRLALIRLAKQYGRYGYRKITELLQIEGWKVNHKRVERIWREEAFQRWLTKVGIKPIRIYPGSPWENGYNERFNGTLRREVLNAEWLHTQNMMWAEMWGKITR